MAIIYKKYISGSTIAGFGAAASLGILPEERASSFSIINGISVAVYFELAALTEL